MANIEIIYRKKWCSIGTDTTSKKFRNACFDPECAHDVCEYFSADHTWMKKNGLDRYCLRSDFSPCASACVKYVYKGWTGKKYEMEQMSDDGLGDYMLVTLENQTYECERVSLNGKCIFDQYVEENDDESKA